MVEGYKFRATEFTGDEETEMVCYVFQCKQYDDSEKKDKLNPTDHTKTIKGNKGLEYEMGKGGLVVAKSNTLYVIGKFDSGTLETVDGAKTNSQKYTQMEWPKKGSTDQPTIKMAKKKPGDDEEKILYTNQDAGLLQQSVCLTAAMLKN